MDNQEKIFQIIVDQDDVTWQTIIYELVKSEQMDPWDINVSLLTKRYIEMVKRLKDHNFRVSGRVLLAAAVLLKIKSTRLVGQDIEELDRMFAQQDVGDELFFEEGVVESLKTTEEDIPNLIPRTPQPRKRKVSVYDLVEALQKALEVKDRRIDRAIPRMKITVPDKKRDISLVIKEVYLRVRKFFLLGNKKLTFTNLIPSDSKQDKVYTFIPLLHLSNQRKVNLVQHEHFGEIEIFMNQKEIDKELGSS